MKTGSIVRGRITGIKPYGAFVKIDDKYDGLIHISEISDGFVKNVEDFIKVGELVDLLIIGVSDDQKLNLSYKRITRKNPKKRIDIILTKGFKPFEDALPNWIKSYSKKR